MSAINLFLLDNLNKRKEVLKIQKSKNYHELLSKIKLELKIIPENYDIFILDDSKKEIKINEGNYYIIKDVLFIREMNKKLLEQSIYELNYNKLSESKQDILDEKYNCMLCSIIIKYENPYLCYKCQTIFHEKCLKEWDNKCKLQNKNLICPKCRNELSIENWNKKLDYEENRKEYANIINKINELESNNNMYDNINFIMNKKIEELKQNNNNNDSLNLLIKKYEAYIKRTLEVFNNILNKIDLIHSLYNLKFNSQLNELLNIIPFNFDNLNIDKILNVINEEFEQFIKYITTNNKIENNVNSFEINNAGLDLDFNQNNIVKEKPIEELILNQIDSNQNLENSNTFHLLPIEGVVSLQQSQEKMDNKIELLNNQNNNFESNPETLFKTRDGRIIFRNGLLRGIIHSYSEINDVVNKIQDMLAKGVKFNLVYKAFDLGDSAEIFHLMCDHLNMSLVLIETNFDVRFGGFTTQSWRGFNIKKIDNNAFVFNLDNNKIYDIIINEPAIGCYPKFGPVFFGCQIRVYDNFFIRGGTTCNKGLNYKTTKNYELNNGMQSYLIKDIEVYSIEL